jgi:Tfp pilus assembly protein PilW
VIRRGVRLGVPYRRVGGDDGISLAEMLIGMFLTAVLGLIVMQAFIASSKGARHVADDGIVQQQQQTTAERLTRDLRVARGIDSTSTASQLVIWVDSNSDYARETGEVITWKLATASGQCRLTRATDAGTNQIISFTIANAGCATAFAYYDGTGAVATSATATRVDVDLSFQNRYSSAPARRSQFSVRMRNVA